jgi:hypothetical protein
VQGFMEFSTRNRMDAHNYTHIGQNLKNWYLELEMRRETTRWEELVQRFRFTFTFEHESPTIDATLQDIQTKIFSEEGPMEVVSVCNAHIANINVHELVEFYNVAKEEHDMEYPMNVQVPET